MIRIFTDNGSNIPDDLIREHNLGVIELICCVEGTPMDFSEPFDGKTFYDNMRAGAEVSTAMPSLGVFLDGFGAALESGDDVIYVGMSGGISGTNALAQSAARELQEQYPDRRIAVIDTRAASLGEGFPALYAAKLVEEGRDFDDVLRLTKDNADHMWQVFTVDDLRYLRRTGRLYSAAVKVTNLLHVKPILTADEVGHIVLRFMNVGRRRALDTLAARYRVRCTDMTGPVGIAHADSPEDTAYLIEKLRAAGCEAEIMTVMYEPVTGSHVGPGAVALFFYGGER